MLLHGTDELLPGVDGCRRGALSSHAGPSPADGASPGVDGAECGGVDGEVGTLNSAMMELNARPPR